MPKINVLEKSVAELIAAGEVVERPSSVIKEMVENSIDAGAKHITVEIKNGGVTYMRVTDDGCGIYAEDVPTAFLRHATSKISSGEDLDNILTLGFRGEALAATASVSRIEMFTKTADADFGTHYMLEGSAEILLEEAGCADGTTIIVRDLFFNTPARMKFLKKDVTEGNSVAAVVERMALSHPEISFKLIRDGKQTISTPGNGDLMAAIYSLLGREFSKTLIEVSCEDNGIEVGGFVCKPVHCRASRSHQFTFLNGRLVHSLTVNAAVEQAYKSSAMVGKFPAFVLNVNIPAQAVDVNVHPAKTEVRFSDEKRVFSAVHYAVKGALTLSDTRPEILPVTPKKSVFQHMSAEQYRQSAIKMEKQGSNIPAKNQIVEGKVSISRSPFLFKDDLKKAAPQDFFAKKEENGGWHKEKVDVLIEVDDTPLKKPEDAVADFKGEEQEYLPENEIRFIGEAFSTYIVVEKGDEIYLIDKHAAHERMLYNAFKKQHTVEVQALLSPVDVRLGDGEYTAVTDNIDLLYKAGFEVEDFGNNTVLVRGFPAALAKTDIESVISQVAEGLQKGSEVQIDALDDIFHSVACKAAIKAGNISSALELKKLAEKVLDDREVMYCPHGRPVAFKIRKYELEKYFGRIQ